MRVLCPSVGAAHTMRSLCHVLKTEKFFAFEGTNDLLVNVSRISCFSRGTEEISLGDVLCFDVQQLGPGRISELFLRSRFFLLGFLKLFRK